VARDLKQIWRDLELGVEYCEVEDCDNEGVMLTDDGTNWVCEDHC
jgi:hypothetical protein